MIIWLINHVCLCHNISLLAICDCYIVELSITRHKAYVHLLLQNLALHVWKPKPKHVLKMFRLDQRQLLLDYWRNLKLKQTFVPVCPRPNVPSQWTPISGNGDKENRETLTSLCFHPPLKSRLTFKYNIIWGNLGQMDSLPSQNWL